MLTYDNSIQFVKDARPPVSLRNFFAPEDGFIWSTGAWCEITFGFSTVSGRGKRDADLILDLDVFKVAGETEGQNVLLYLNGLRIGSHYVTRRTTVVIPIDAAILKNENNVLTFDTPERKRPSDYGIADERQLGIQLFSMQLRPAVQR
jgi:hypothetical protein